MAKDKELKDQLEGLFADADHEPESTSEESGRLTEQKIIDILESKAEAVPAVAELAATEPPMIETNIFLPTFAPSQLKDAKGEIERPEPRPAPVDFLTWEVQLREQRIRTMNIMLGVLAGIGSVIIALLLVNLIREPGLLFQAYIPYFAAYAVLMMLTLARRLNPTVRAATLVVLTYSLGIAALLMEGPLSAGGLFLLAAPLLASTLIKQRAGAIAVLASSLLYAGFLLA
ncbi:MAG: hypothetical protein V3S14_11720, partial [Anaerolineae bacterium]